MVYRCVCESNCLWYTIFQNGQQRLSQKSWKKGDLSYIHVLVEQKNERTGNQTFWQPITEFGIWILFNKLRNATLTLTYANLWNNPSLWT